MSDTKSASGGNKAVHIIKHELVAMLPSLIFFLIGFNLIAFGLHLILQPHGVAFNDSIKASVGALVIAKVVLIVDLLPLIRKFEGRPLIRPVLYRTFVYTVFTIFAHVLEEVIRAWVHAGNLSAGIDAWVAAFVWQNLTFVSIWVFVLFLVFVTFDEIRRFYKLPVLPHILWARDHD